MDWWIKFGKAWVKIFAYQILDILTNKLLLFHSNNPYLWQSHQFEVSLHSWWIWPNVRHFEIIFIIVIVHITPQKFSKLKVMYYFFSLDGGPPLLSRIPTSSAKETASLKTTFWTIFCFVFVVQFSFLDLIKLLKREFNLAKRLWINEIDENLMNRYDANLLLIIEHTWKSWNDVVHFYSCVFTGRSFQFLLFLRSSNINLISDVLWF